MKQNRGSETMTLTTPPQLADPTLYKSHRSMFFIYFRPPKTSQSRTSPEGADAQPPLIDREEVLQQAHRRVQLRVGVHGAAALPVGVPIHLGDEREHGGKEQKKKKKKK